MKLRIKKFLKKTVFLRERFLHFVSFIYLFWALKENLFQKKIYPDNFFDEADVMKYGYAVTKGSAFPGCLS